MKIINELLSSTEGILDKVVTTKAEKMEAKRLMKKIILKYEAKKDEEISKRWEYDMKNGNQLTRSVRPLVLIFMIVCTMIMIFIDAGHIKFNVSEAHTDLLTIILTTCIGAYFGGRSFEKIKKS